MNHQADHEGMEELAAVAGLLRAERSEMTAHELDELRLRVRGRTTPAARPMTRKAQFMKSRLALVSMLTVGLLMSLSGVGFAVSAITDDNSAAVSQYGTTGDTNVLGEQETGEGDTPGVAGVNEEDGPAVAGVQAQGATAKDDSLPFTGFAAIPLLLGGIALLAGGAVMRRRVSDQV